MSAVETAGVVSPPTHVRDGVMASIVAETLGPALRTAVSTLPPEGLGAKVAQAIISPLEAARSRRPPRLRGLLSAAATFGALVFAIVSWSQLQDARDQLRDGRPIPSSGIPEGHETQVLTLGGEMTGNATLVHYRHDNFRLTLSVDGFDVTPAGFQYAVWLRGDGGDVPLGGFRLKRQDDFKVAFAIAVDPALYPEIVVTLEPTDGNEMLTGKVVSSAMLDVASVHHGKYDK
jgi:hypothetical protein